MDDLILYEKIVKTYLENGSIKLTAKTLNTSVVKVRKVLITEGLWSSKTSKRVGELLKLGKSTREIANLLYISEKGVQQYLPYTRGSYDADNKTISATNCLDYRERIKVAKENFVNKERKSIKKDFWSDNNDLDYIRSFNMSDGFKIPSRAYDSKVYDIPSVIRLKLELFHDSRDPDELEILRAYGNVKYGNTITRDILVPSTMPLWALNYAIQKCFGFQNSHLHAYMLPDDVLDNIVEGSFYNYATLVGAIFRSPVMDEDDIFWQDDYEGGSFKVWLKSKYKGPYRAICQGEGIYRSRVDIDTFCKKYEYVKVEREYLSSGYSYFKCVTPITRIEYKNGLINKIEDDNDGVSVITEYYTLKDLPYNVGARIFDVDINTLLERLSIGEILSVNSKKNLPKSYSDVMNKELSLQIAKYQQVDSPLMQPKLKPITDELIYNYDFGDNWIIKIKAYDNADDLLEEKRLTQDELDDAIINVLTKYMPTCINQDGYPVLDDVGGISGYVEFLKGINNKADGGLYEDARESLEWARSLGWSKRKISNKNLL